MATRRRTSNPPSIEIKQFTPEEIEQGIAKLQRRIGQVKALETAQVTYDDQRVKTAEDDIGTTVLEIFGEHSPEYNNHRYHLIWHEARIPNHMDSFTAWN